MLCGEIIIENVIDNFEMKKNLESDTVQITNDIDNQQVREKNNEDVIHNNSITNNSRRDCPFSHDVSEEHNYSLKGDKSEPNKKKRQYVSPCPEMEIHHKQAQTKKQKGVKELFIHNGKGLKPKIIKSMKYIHEDTSAFDSIAEILLFAYRHISDFRCYSDDEKCLCKNKNLCFIKLIIDFSKSKKSDHFYKCRAHLYYELGYVKKDRLICDDRIGQLFLKLLNNHFSLKKSFECGFCHKRFEQNYTILKLFSNHPVTMKSLEKEFQCHYFSDKRSCEECGFSVEIVTEIGSYLAIDLEHALCF